MVTKKRSFIDRIPFLGRHTRDEAPAKIDEWLDYRVSKQAIPLAIRGLTTRLVEELYPKETQIVTLVVDQLLDEADPQPVKATDSQRIDGLGFGTLVDLGSAKAYTWAAHIMLQVVALAETRSLTVAEAVRLLPTMPSLYESLLARAKNEYGLEDKEARRFMEATLDYIDPHLRFELGKVVPMEEHRYCEFKKIESSNPVNSIKDYAQEYIAAFLNRAGGRIYFGITDKDRVVRGEPLSSRCRDELQQKIAGKLRELVPPVTPDYYRVNFHPVVDGQGSPIPDLVIVEIIVPLALDREATRTQSGRKPIMGDGHVYMERPTSRDS